MRVFKYARVSLEEEDTELAQNPEAQLIPMRVECVKNRWEQAGEFVDRTSGSKMFRQEFKHMMELAAQGNCDMIMVAWVDRFSRFKTLDALNVIDQLKEMGVLFYSLREPYASTYNNPLPETLRTPITALILAAGEEERNRIKGRVKMGILAKRATCKTCKHPQETHTPKCNMEGCPCATFVSSWGGGRPKGSLDKKQRRPMTFNKDMTVDELFKPIA